MFKTVVHAQYRFLNQNYVIPPQHKGRHEYTNLKWHEFQENLKASMDKILLIEQNYSNLEDKFWGKESVQHIIIQI